jgi:hypothetical protein
VRSKGEKNFGRVEKSSTKVGKKFNIKKMKHMKCDNTQQRKERLQKRNEKVRQLFEELSAKHPQWKVDALVEEVANIMFLSPRTIVAILSFQGGYAER